MITLSEKIHVFEHSQISGPFMSEAITATYVEALAALREKAEHENSKPLTLDELRDCRETCTAVYVCNIDKSPMFKGQIYCAAVLDVIPAFGSPVMHLQAIFGRNLTLAEGDYGKTWLAYRYKPMQSKTEL